MKVYCIVYEKIHDPAMFDTYRQQVIPTMEPYGGKFVVRGGKFTVLEGDMPYERVVILEFPSRKSAEDWYNSPAYQKILPFRLKSTKCSFVVADGFE
jgi:uncharacterized protein (DUF1330 family)